MKWIKITLIWICFIPVAIINGSFRDYLLDKYLPENISLAISGIILSGLIFVITMLLLPRIKRLSEKDCVKIGVQWMLLTVVFEFYFGLSSGSTWSELIEAYNPLKGNLWILVLLSTFLSPMWVFKSQMK